MPKKMGVISHAWVPLRSAYSTYTYNQSLHKKHDNRRFPILNFYSNPFGFETGYKTIIRSQCCGSDSSIYRSGNKAFDNTVYRSGSRSRRDNNKRIKLDLDLNAIFHGIEL
jgi:hypothetical protein